jgi:hypothetical protein
MPMSSAKTDNRKPRTQGIASAAILEGAAPHPRKALLPSDFRPPPPSLRGLMITDCVIGSRSSLIIVQLSSGSSSSSASSLLAAPGCCFAGFLISDLAYSRSR